MVKYLPTSPEFHLKKLLVGGWQRVFEIHKCFRNGEAGAIHQPEFYMLEWYRVNEELTSLKKDVILLIEHLQNWAITKGVPQQKQDTHQDALDETMPSLFQKEVHFNLTPQTSKKELEDLLDQLNINRAPDDTWNDLFFRVFLEKIEPQLKNKGKVFVSDFPPSMAALAKIDDCGWAQRFEFYWQGLEIANAFYELTDAEEQMKRFEEDLREKDRLKKERVPIDEDFISSLKEGMPPSSGIALGLERLFMAITGIKDIREFKLFPH